MKMLCDECKINIAEYYKVIEINGQRSERHLCAACQKKHNDFSLLKFSGLGSLFSTFNESPPAERSKQIICGECGTTYDEFLKTGYLGCAACYSGFKNGLTPIIYKTQGSALHTGKRPRLTPEDVLQQKLAQLRKELEAAVAEERFGDAQLIKSEIDDLRKQ